MKKINIAYFGTPIFAAELLQNIFNEKNFPIDIKLIVTQPDKKVGRKQILTPSPVKTIAIKNDIEVFDGNAKSEELKQLMKAKNIDLVLLYAYGEIITQELLDVPKFGFWNIHPSLLPLYRGASPITFPLLLNDKTTGVSLMQMDSKLDHGPIIDQLKYEIQATDLRSDLENKLTQMAFNLFKQNILLLSESNTISLKEQNHVTATFTRMLSKDGGFIPYNVLKNTLSGNNIEFIPQIIQDYQKKNTIQYILKNNPSKTIQNMFRSLYSWPGIWTIVKINDQEKRLKITSINMDENELKIEKVQLEGKNEVDFKTFCTAYSLF